MPEKPKETAIEKVADLNKIMTLVKSIIAIVVTLVTLIGAYYSLNYEIKTIKAKQVELEKKLEKSRKFSRLKVKKETFAILDASVKKIKDSLKGCECYKELNDLQRIIEYLKRSTTEATELVERSAKKEKETEFQKEAGKHRFKALRGPAPKSNKKPSTPKIKNKDLEKIMAIKKKKQEGKKITNKEKKLIDKLKQKK